MVVDCVTAVPVVAPVAPAPTESSEEADVEADSKSDPNSAQEDSRHGIQAWIGDNRRSVYKPGIVGRHVDDVGAGRLDGDRAVVIGYGLLLRAFRVATLPSLLTHRLHSVGNTLRVVGVGVAEG